MNNKKVYFVKYIGWFILSICVIIFFYNSLEDRIIDEKNYIHDSNLNNAIHKNVKDKIVLTPQMFGAKGNGINDDYVAIQKCIDTAFLNKKIVYFSPGVYLISKPLICYGLNDEVRNGFGSRLIGANRAGARIVKISNQVLENVQYNENAVIIIANRGYVVGNLNSKKAYGVSIENIGLDGNGQAEYGLCMPVATAESTFKNLEIQNCLDSGVWSGANNYLNLYEKIRVSNCKECGFNLRGGINTSDNLLNCYVNGSKIGYSISGIYMQITNSCADGISDTVCKLDRFRGTLTSFGSEAKKASVMFKAGAKSNVTIINPYTWGNFDNFDATHIKVVNGGVVTIIGGQILIDYKEKNRIAPGKLYLLEGKDSYLSLSNCIVGRYEQNNINDKNSRLIINGSNGSVAGRGEGPIAYIGYDTFKNRGYVDVTAGNPEILGNAIFMGFGDDFTKLHNGRSIDYCDPIMQGDILLTREPKRVGGIGWIQNKSFKDKNENWASGDYLKIPIVDSGTTSDRPKTSLVVGQMYFDITIGKPIWCKDIKGIWIDANGNVI